MAKSTVKSMQTETEVTTKKNQSAKKILTAEGWKRRQIAEKSKGTKSKLTHE